MLVKRKLSPEIYVTRELLFSIISCKPQDFLVVFLTVGSVSSTEVLTVFGKKEIP